MSFASVPTRHPIFFGEVNGCMAIGSPGFVDNMHQENRKAHEVAFLVRLPGVVKLPNTILENLVSDVDCHVKIDA